MSLRLSLTQHAAFVAGARIAKERHGKRWENQLADQLDGAGVAYQREFRFVPGRMFRFDFRIVGSDLAVEVDGAVHRIKGQFARDLDKGHLALLHGWRVLHVSPHQVRSGVALKLIRLLLQPPASGH